MWQMVFAVSCPIGLDKAPVEMPNGEVQFCCPPLSCRWLIVIGMDVELASEAGRFMKTICPLHEKPKRVGIRVGHAQLILSLEAFAPVESHASEPKLVVDQVLRFKSRLGLDPPDLSVPLPLSITTDPGNSRPRVLAVAAP